MSIYEQLTQAARGINKFALDEEQIRQPALYHDIADQLSLAISKKDELETAAKQIRADRDAEIRQDFAEREEKLTEKALEAELLRDDAVKAALADAAEMAVEVRRWSNLLETVKQRGHALRVLGDLYLGGYFQATSTGSGRVRAQEARSDANKEAAGKLRRERVRSGGES